MSTATQPTSKGARAAQVLRDSWDRVKGPGATALGGIAAFFLFYPPLAQGIYYLLRGLWPLLPMGPVDASSATDTHIWLAQSGGVATLVIGAALCLAAYRRQGSPEVLVLALGSALGLTVLDLIGVSQGRLPAVYLLDAGIQVGLVACWVYGWRKAEARLAQAARVPPDAAAVTPAEPQPVTIPFRPPVG